MKDLFLLDHNITYLNHGSYGACPAVVFENYQSWQRKLEEGPVQFMKKTLWENLKISRDVLGEFIGCDGGDLLLFPNPTTAVNNIIENLNLSEGDELLMTQHEYGALVRAWSRSSMKNKFSVVQQHIDLPFNSKNDFIDQFLAGITKNTKVIFISQITSQTGLIFPVKKICDYAHQKGIITIVDGAHVPGHIDLDLVELGCDYYTGACHKWMCSPKGVAFLYVKEEFQQMMEPLVVSWGYEAENPSHSQFLDYMQWQGTNDISAYLTVPDTIQFLENHNWKEKAAKCKELNLWAKNEISSQLNIKELGSDNFLGQMTTFSFPLDDTIEQQKKFYNKYKIQVPFIKWNEQTFFRISSQVYNSKEDFIYLIDSLKEFKNI